MNFSLRTRVRRDCFGFCATTACVLWVLMLSMAAGMAAGIVLVPVESLATRAEWILRGTVESLETSRGTGGVISTRAELNVAEVWKGPNTQRTVLTLAGGVLGDRQVVVSGQATFKVGEEVVVFLVRNERGEGVVLELAQGKFRVTQDSSKQRWVSNGVLGAGDATEGSATTQAVKVVMPHQRPLGLQELKRRVLEALKP